VLVVDVHLDELLYSVNNTHYNSWNQFQTPVSSYTIQGYYSQILVYKYDAAGLWDNPIITELFNVCTTLVKFVRVSTFCGSSNDTDFSNTGALVARGFIVGGSNDTADYMQANYTCKFSPIYVCMNTYCICASSTYVATKYNYIPVCTWVNQRNHQEDKLVIYW